MGREIISSKQLFKYYIEHKGKESREAMRIVLFKAGEKCDSRKTKPAHRPRPGS